MFFVSSWWEKKRGNKEKVSCAGKEEKKGGFIRIEFRDQRTVRFSKRKKEKGSEVLPPGRKGEAQNFALSF